MRPILIVAQKEFMDHLMSKRFIAIFAILMLLCIAGIASSMNAYDQSMDAYKKNQYENPLQPGFQEQVAGLQKQIMDLQAYGGSADEIQMLRQQLELLVNPPIPSILSVFGMVNNGGSVGGGFFSMMIILIAMALGFDLITREKEEGSLKSLLSHPVFRDEVVNGKLLGAVATLAVVMGIVFIVTVVVMMFYGAMLTTDDLARLGAFFILATLYSSVIFAISVMFSTICRTSVMSILCVIAIIILFMVVPSLTPNIASAVLGPTPEMSQIPQYINVIGSEVGGSGANGTQQVINPAYYQYYTRQFMLTDTINTLSPLYSFDSRISAAILFKESSSTGPVPYSKALTQSPIYVEPSLWDSLAYAWIDILALITEFVVFAAITYVLFMRLDVQ